MSNLTNIYFEVLDITGDNYLAWALDAEFHLKAKGLGNTIIEGNTAEEEKKAQAMIFVRRHLHEGLKGEYLTVKEPEVLWKDLKERYDHQKTVILPKARYDWMHLRLQDFKSVSEYNSAMFRITSKLKLCGETITDVDMLEKTFSTFHASNVVLQKQYREKGYTKYSQLISSLFVAEQNNELLMKNHGLRPSGSAPFPEANVTSYDRKEENHANNRGRGSGYRRGHSRGRGRRQEYGRGRGRVSFKKPYSHQKWEKRDGNKQEKETNENKCYRCGAKDHWARMCLTPKYYVDLYQQSLKQNGKKVETNLVYEDGEHDFDHGDVTHMEVSDFLPHAKK
ncbi:uncharacterized protein LOC112082113 [Eutrema salsugineum]|uniref:uncharacterized protein LOC112082113 n=1 Tax=Eutrema salsugineum TaxID=72664 RepID=UPI000CED439E|nr:uncharacterized protein LOC112082113 [Eutrema salsugineum]